jgi:hypothetical protein
MSDSNATPLTYVVNRKDVRYELAKHIEGGGTDFQEIYAYQTDNIKGESPVCRIMSSSTDRPKMTFKGVFAVFGFTVQVLVLFKDTQERVGEDSNTWTPQDAEDKLDDLEHQLSRVLFHMDINATSKIKSIEQAGPSRIRKDVVQGKTYLIEYIPVLVEAFYG